MRVIPLSFQGVMTAYSTPEDAIKGVHDRKHDKSPNGFIGGIKPSNILSIKYDDRRLFIDTVDFAMLFFAQDNFVHTEILPSSAHFGISLEGEEDAYIRIDQSENILWQRKEMASARIGMSFSGAFRRDGLIFLYVSGCRTLLLQSGITLDQEKGVQETVPILYWSETE